MVSFNPPPSIETGRRRTPPLPPNRKNADPCRGSLRPSERKKYTDAVLCLLEKPPKLSAPDAQGIRNRYDDFVSVHIRKTEHIHFTVRATG